MQENLIILLNKKINDKIYTTIKATFTNVNLDRVSKDTLSICEYNNEINKFAQNIHVNYGILLEFTVLEIPEVSHWAETFQVLTNSNGHQETQPAPVSTTNQPTQVNVILNQQQDEIDRLVQVMQQWSAEGLCQYHHTQQTKYKHG